MSRVFKYWKHICEVGRQDWRVMMAVAMCDPSSVIGRKLQQVFPECFTAELCFTYPVPLSVLKTRAMELEKECNPLEWMVTSGVFAEFNVPVFLFRLKPYAHSQLTAPPVPDDLHLTADMKLGDVVAWRGKTYVVVQNEQDTEFVVYLVPAECVDTNL